MKNDAVPNEKSLSSLYASRFPPLSSNSPTVSTGPSAYTWRSVAVDTVILK